MTCCNTRVTTTNNNNANATTIAAILRNLDQMQRNAVISTAINTCENCMLTAMYNTKPINVYGNCGIFEAMVGVDGPTTNLFRVEAVKGDDTVILRLLTNTAGVITCTSYTCVVNINCICAIQCFDPINCDTSCFPVLG